MSLIQEALKRKAEESAGTHPVSTQTAAQPQEKKKNMPLIALLGLLLLISFLAILSGVALRLLNVPVLEPVLEPVAVKPAAPSSAPAPDPVPERVVTPEPVAKKKPASPPKESWPDLRLTGIASSGSRTIAIINGKMLSTGNRIGEVTVVRVDSTQVVVEYRGMRRVLKVEE